MVYGSSKTRYGNYARAAAGAAAYARTLMQRRKTGGTMFKKSRAGPTRRPRVRNYVRSGTTLMTKKKRTVTKNYSNEATNTNLAVATKAMTAMSLINAMLEPSWFRIQGLTEYDKAFGFYPCANRNYPASLSTTGHALPMYWVDLTSQPNYADGALVNTSVVNQAWFSDFTYTADANTVVMGSTNSGGTAVATSNWEFENTASIESFAHRKSIHDYTSIQLNLYGVRQRSTTWDIQIVKVNDQFAEPLNAAGSNLEKRKAWDYLMRPYIFSNLNQGDPQTKPDITVIKSFQVTIGPISTTDYPGATAAPHLHTLKWFVRHNKVRHYDWRRADIVSSSQIPNWDAETGTGTQARADPKERIYLLIRALSPSRRTMVAGETPMTDADPTTEPSFDLMLRNKWRTPS